MSEELFGVSVGRNQNYNGRDRLGNIQFGPHGGGVFMSRQCADDLCKVLKPEYPNVRPVELLRGDRDDATVTSLAELGEDVGLDKLALVIEQCFNQGFTGPEILLKCKNTVDAAEASVSKQQRIRELEQEAARLRSA